MSGSEKPGHGDAIEALPEETGSPRLGVAYRYGARVRLYRKMKVQFDDWFRSHKGTSVRPIMCRVVTLLASITIGCLLQACGGRSSVTGPSSGSASNVLEETLSGGNGSTGFISVPVGVWMFRRPELSWAAIANWGGRPWMNEELFEPINAAWIDFAASSQADAARRLTQFLQRSAFLPDNLWLCGIHTSGLFAFIGGQPHPQLRGTWSSGNGCLLNDHGRVFGPAHVTTTTGRTAFVSVGAFSQEDGSFTLHSYVPDGFNHASNELRGDHPENALDGWTEPNAPRAHVDNEAPVPEDYRTPYGTSYNTDTHNGVRLFVAYTSTEAIYQYTGNGFEQFSCGPRSCANPQPGQTSYTTSDRVSLTLTLTYRLPPNVSPLSEGQLTGLLCYPPTPTCEYHATLSDGQRVLTASGTQWDDSAFHFAYSTDAAGRIVRWTACLTASVGPGNCLILTGIDNRGVALDAAWKSSSDNAHVLGRPGTWTILVR